jgi:pimeloyl-[acyl-carrier protein] methyl ester esterase
VTRLHRETAGHGRDVALIHGWGLHGGIWALLAAELSARFRVHTIDLPGHGLSRDCPMPGASIEDLALALLEEIPRPAAWVGWSLGGMAALSAARLAPAAVTKLALISTTPRFVAGDDWPHGLAAETFNQFAADLETDYRATLWRFLSLQVGSDEGGRDLLRGLRTHMAARAEPTKAALRAGLRLLHDSDLRPALAHIAVTARVWHGGRDRLVPRSAGEYLAGHLPHAGFESIDVAGHAPFLSHAPLMADQLMTFLEQP